MAKKNKKQLEEELNRYGREYEIAKRKGDRQGMAAAHAKANQTRKQAGWTYDKKRGYTVDGARIVNSRENLTFAKTKTKNTVEAIKQAEQSKPLTKRFTPSVSQSKPKPKPQKKKSQSYRTTPQIQTSNAFTPPPSALSAPQVPKRNLTSSAFTPPQPSPTSQTPAITSNAFPAPLSVWQQAERERKRTKDAEQATRERALEKLKWQYQQQEDFKPFGTVPQAAAYGLERGAAGIAGGIENIAHGAAGLVNQALEFTTSLGGKMPNPVSEWFGENEQFNHDFRWTDAWKQSIEERYRPTDSMRKAADIGENISNMAPSILADVAWNMYTGGAPAIAKGVTALAHAAKESPRIGMALMALNSYGAGAHRAKMEGADDDTASLYGALSAAGETLTENMFSAIPGLDRTGVLSKAVNQLVKNPILAKGIDIAGEGAEEAVMAVADPYLQRLTYNPDAKQASPEEIREQALMGMLSAGILQGGAAIGNRTGRYSERNHQYSAPRNQQIPDFEAQWNRYNQMGQAGLPFEQVIPYETGTPVDYETAYSAHASGYNDFIERTKQTATRILSGNEADLPEIADAVVSPPARQMLEQGLKLTLSQNASQAVRQVREAAKITSNPANSQALGVSENGQKNNVSGETQYKIKTLPDGRRYVKADREVITGDDPKAWSKQAEQFINDVIRNGEDITVFTQDGFEVKITDRSAYKLSDPHVQSVQKIGRALLPDADLGAKMRAAGHIDELLEISRWDNYRPDKNGNHANDIGEKGFDYFTTYFEDFDGTYYAVKISAGVNDGAGVYINDDMDTVYSIGNPEKRSPMHRRGSSNSPFVSGAQSGVQRTSSDSSIVQNQSAGNPQTQTVTQMQQTPATRQTGVIENRAAHTVDKRTVDTIDRIAKRTGFSVEFVQGVPEAGSYQDGKIRINTESGDPVRQIFVHELTHYLEQSGEYHTLADAIANNLEHSQVDTSVLKRQIINEYAKNGVVLSEDGANREMIAKYAESYLFADASSIQRLAQENRSLVQKIRDWLHDLRVKLRGTAEEKFILRTEKLYQKALNSVNGQKNNASGETQYSFSEQKIPSYEELIAKPDIPVVDIRGRGEGRIAEQRKQFLNSPEAHKLYEAPVINRDTGEPVFITSRALEHTFSNRGLNQINVGKHLKEIIEHAVLTHAEEATHGADNVSGVYTLFGAVQTEQGIQPVKLKVKEYIDDGRSLPQFIKQYFEKNGKQNPYASAYDGRVLELESIEKEEASSSVLTGTEINSVQGRYPSTSSNIRVADLYDLVNSEYQKYLPQKGQGNPAYAQGSSFDKLLRDAGYKKQADALKKAVKQYGTYERGEYAARNVQIPKQMNDETRVSRFSRTAAEASVLTDEQAGEIGKAVAEGRFDYEPIPDEAARAHAESIMERGESAAQNVWDRIVNSTHSASKKDIAVGEYLLKQAAEAGDTQRVVELAAQIAAEGTRAGQIVQAMRMLKKLDGAGQAIALDTTLKKLQAELDSNQKNKTFLEVPPELRERLVAAKGEQQVGEVMDEIYQNIADQLPVRWSDKWNAWRYLSMLGNPRTHIRNVLGNTAFAPVVGVKNVIGTVLESAVQNTQRLAGKEGITRTKTISGNIPFTGGKTRAFAIRDFAEVQDILKGGGKMNPSDIIREKQSVFKFKPLAYLQQMNFNLLEAEDAMFLKSHYVRAMVQFMNSNKVNMETFAPETNKKDAMLLHKARDYAIKEAQKATYRDFSQAAQAISQMSRNSGNLGSVFIEGVLPFKKTPINVLKRGVEYSPVGLLETVTIGTKKLASGQINGNEFIDRLSAGLTGTGISILGFLLSKLGYVDGSLGDEKDEKFRKSLGAQPYAIKIGNQSYTIDWLAPASMPFFVGAEMQRVAEELEGLNGRVIWDSTMNIMEPMTKMSMLDGLNGAISAVRYGEDPLSDLFTNAVIDYIGQAVPTLFGQIARTIDDTGRSTYIDKNSGVPDVMQKAFQKNRNKIPLLSQQSVAYRDVFGRAQSNPSMVSRAFQNMLSPGFLSQEKVGAMEKEMIRVYQATKDGEHCPIPSNAPKSFEVDKKTKYLTAEEYEKFTYSRGALMYSSLNELTQSKGYQGLDDANKAKAAKKVISYATAAAKMEVSDYKPTGEYAKAIQAWKKQKISFAQYALIQSAMPDKGLTDKNGESIQNSKSLLMMDTLWNTPGLSEKQREYLYEDFKVSKKTRHYNKALVAQTLDKMRRE